MSDKDLMERVQPFSNGTEYINWLSNNCYQCKWGYENNNNLMTCAVESSLDRARDTDGLVRQWIVMTHMYSTCENFSERKEVKNGK